MSASSSSSRSAHIHVRPVKRLIGGDAENDISKPSSKRNRHNNEGGRKTPSGSRVVTINGGGKVEGYNHSSFVRRSKIHPNHLPRWLKTGEECTSSSSSSVPQINNY